jgi:hypothetical protein
MYMLLDEARHFLIRIFALRREGAEGMEDVPHARPDLKLNCAACLTDFLGHAHGII